MKSIIFCCLIFTFVLLSGCSATNTNQVIHHSVIHGAGGSIGIPVNSSGTAKFGLSAWIGYYEEDDGVNPTKAGSNVYAAPMAISAHSRSKQNTTSNYTNALTPYAMLLEGSDDGSIVNLGNGSVNDQSGTRTSSAGGK
jgi:hypothetical protein